MRWFHRATEDASPVALESHKQSEQSGAEDADRSALVHDTRESEAESAIAGERGIISVNRAQSLQSRISSVLALGLVSVLGLSLLGWYYKQMLARQTRTQENAVAAVKNRVQGEMPLPRLEGVRERAPQLEAARTATLSPAETAALERFFGPAPELPPRYVMDEWEAHAPIVPAPVSSPAGPPQPDRRLAGRVFATGESGADCVKRTPQGAAGHSYICESPGRAAGAPGGSAAQSPVLAEAGELSSRLRPSITPAVEAQVLPTLRLLLPQGASIDCTLETAIDSTLPGLTTCVTATDIFSADGTVVLLERGTKLTGEASAQVRQGAARVFVVWTRARTPTGVVVQLDSPGTDELGRAGLPGEVKRHFWERFGAAILVSIIDGAVQSAVQSSSDGDAVVINPSGSQTVMTEVLKNTVNIPPTIVKSHGDRIQVLVARDLDFRSVYELRPVAAR